MEKQKTSAIVGGVMVTPSLRSTEQLLPGPVVLACEATSFSKVLFWGVVQAPSSRRKSFWFPKLGGFTSGDGGLTRGGKKTGTWGLPRRTSRKTGAGMSASVRAVPRAGCGDGWAHPVRVGTARKSKNSGE